MILLMYDLVRFFYLYVLKKKKKIVKVLDLIIFFLEKCGNFVDCGGSVYW